MNRYMPSYMREAIARGEGDLRCIDWPSAPFRLLIDRWRRELGEGWQSACDEYWSGFRKVETKLPADRDRIHSLHDSKVLDVRLEADGDTIYLLLDSSGSMLCEERTVLCCINVTACTLPEDLYGSWWLYEELEPNDDGSVELRALLSVNWGYLRLNELAVTAKGIQVLEAEWRLAE